MALGVVAVSSYSVSSEPAELTTGVGGSVGGGSGSLGVSGASTGGSAAAVAGSVSVLASGGAASGGAAGGSAASGKPACGWKGNVGGRTPVQACSVDDKPLSNYDAQAAHRL